MAITVTHPTAAIEPGDGDPNKIQPEDWNMNHTVVGTVDIANGGTGANSEAGARTNLGLGTIATQNSNNVSITGGSIAGVTIAGLDANTTFQDNADPTKQMRFELSGVSAGQTRILTVPDFDGTVATLAGAESLTNKTLVDTTNLEVTNLKAKDGTAAGTIADTTGVVTLASSVLTTTDINGGTIDGTTQASGTINGPIAAGGTWTAAATWTLPAYTLGGTVTSNGQSFSGTIANLGTVTTVDLNGGTIDDTTIGGASAAAGTFTTLTSTGNATLGDASADAHTLNGTMTVATASKILLDDSITTAGANLPLAFDGDADTGLFRPATNTIAIATNSTERMRIDSAGNVGIGVTPLAYQKLAVSGTYPSNSSITEVVSLRGIIPAGSTSSHDSFLSRITTEAAVFTLANLRHFYANPGTFGAGSAVTNQIGYVVSANLIAASTNNTGFLCADIGGASATAGKTMYGYKSDITTASGGGTAWNFYAAGTAPNYFAGTIASLGSYTATTASAANTFIDSAGLIQRSTSSIRYKKDVETLEHSYADNVIFSVRPVWYRSTCDNDNAQWGWYGLIAEEVAAIDPRLVHWGYPHKLVEQSPVEPAKDAVIDEHGNVIEEAVPAKEATYKEVPDTDAPLQAEGVQYDRLTVMLIDVVQRQQKQIDALTERIAALEKA